MQTHTQADQTFQEICNSLKIHLKTNTHNLPQWPHYSLSLWGKRVHKFPWKYDGLSHPKERNAFSFKGLVSHLKFLSVPLVKDPCLIRML